MNPTLEREDAFGSAAFQRFPIAITRGKGSTVWDDGGKPYLDFMTGYGAALVGHCNPAVTAAVKRQSEVLITCHGSFYNEERAGLLERLTKAAPKGLQSALLTNSGAETVEAALKLARRHTGRKKVVSMKGGFHGKTYGALSATWNKKYRDPFAPLLDGFEFADYGDADGLERLVGDDTAAVIAEPIQGESGVVLPPPDYFARVREICDSKGALLVMDEIQTGLGRTGKMWASEHWGVVPDVMTVSKALGGGLPIGAALTTREVIGSLKKGEHTSTFAGNPLACAAASAALDFIREQDLPAQAAKKGARMMEQLRRIAAAHTIAREVRGLGLMLAMVMRVDVRDILFASIEKGVIFAYSGRETVRFLPPLVIDEEEIVTGLDVLDGVLADDEKRRFG